MELVIVAIAFVIGTAYGVERNVWARRNFGGIRWK